LRISSSSGVSWILKARIKELKEIDAIFFDCDGVLIDVRKSCEAAIAKTVRFLARGTMGMSVPRQFSFAQAATRLRKSGGFNNDWNVSYALLLGLFAYASWKKETQESATKRDTAYAQKQIAEDSSIINTNTITDAMRWACVGERLVQLVERADFTGIESVIRTLAEEGYSERITILKGLLGYPVESSIVGRVYDELFYGGELFRKKFGIDPKFSDSKGLVEKETPLVKQNTFELLEGRFSTGKLGIISGRDYISASKTLGSLMKNFEQNNLIFLMGESNHKTTRQECVQPILNKPNPEIMFKAVKNIGPFRRCLYVGDSAEDLIMVQRANSKAPRFAFAGVYGYVNFKNETQSYFVTEKADIITPSVNNLPNVLARIGEMEE
jgi:phosphoglycolate phosphatase-like HAD superfamily hydrolase